MYQCDIDQLQDIKSAVLPIKNPMLLHSVYYNNLYYNYCIQYTTRSIDQLHDIKSAVLPIKNPVLLHSIY